MHSSGAVVFSFLLGGFIVKNKLFIIFCQMQCLYWSRGLMDKASVFGTEDCRFESCRDRLAWSILLQIPSC